MTSEPRATVKSQVLWRETFDQLKEKGDWQVSDAKATVTWTHKVKHVNSTERSDKTTATSLAVRRKAEA